MRRLDVAACCRCAMAGAGPGATCRRAHCRRTAANTGGAHSFLVVRRHTNTDNITDSSHSNDSLYSPREYIGFKFFYQFIWYEGSPQKHWQSFARHPLRRKLIVYFPSNSIRYVI
ncbi:hypothetical protein EMIT0111MI5_90209 [Burkholderia sp. IT-111MI5]